MTLDSYSTHPSDVGGHRRGSLSVRPAEEYLDEDSHSSEGGDRWVPENLSYLL